MLETLLNFRNIDSTENLNARLAGLIPKGVVKGGFVIPEPASLQVRITGDGESPFVLLAFATDGMVIRERSEEHVLPVPAGITSVIALRAKYVESLGGTIAQFEVIPLGSYQTDPNPDSIIRLCSVTPPAGTTAILSEHINMSFRDSIEGFSRKIVREVVGTKEDLPAVSGFPAIAEMNFLHNEFAFNTEVEIGTGSGIVSYPLVQAINFRVAEPSVPGLSRLHPEQVEMVSVSQSPITGMVTAISASPHGFTTGNTVRITANSASQANQVWQVIDPLLSVIVTANNGTNVLAGIGHSLVTGQKVQVSSTGTLPAGLLAGTDYYAVVLSVNTLKISDTMEHALAGVNIIEFTDDGTGVHTLHPQADTAFYFNAPLTLAWSGTGGNAVDTTVGAIVTAKMAAGVTHSLSVGNDFTLINSTDMTFEGLFTVASVIDAQTITYTQTGYPSADSGNGIVQKQGISLPNNAVEIGESATGTAANFETIFNASLLGPDITATAIGSSLQFRATALGIIGNSYTIEKTEPNVAPEDVAIVLSGDTFAGGVDPNPTSSLVDLVEGDLYIVLSGESGTLEIWGYDGVIFRNLTSSSTATMLDFHRRNLFLNEKHLTENEKGALAGTVGIPSATNRYVTQEDTSTLTSDLSAALQGADNVPPSGKNRYLTEARQRGERGGIAVPAGQYWVEVPVGNGIDNWDLIAGADNSGTDSSRAIPFFNVVFTDSLLNAGGPTEYSQIDFTPVVVEKIYVTRATESDPPPFITELDPSQWVTSEGVFPRPDAVLLDLPTRMWAKLNVIPDNGMANLLFSKVVPERQRGPSADMFTTPQRIIPAQVQDIINRAQELRFNAGIKVSGTSVEFPANLFKSINLQNLTLTRVVGSKVVGLDAGFTIDLEAGTGTGGIVESFTPVEFTALTSTMWTKYQIALTPQGTIVIRHVEHLLETASDLAYSATMSSVSTGSMPYADGSYTFATIAVKSTGVVGTTIEDLLITNLELYPYQATNEKDYASPIICGDGITSYGHFTGTDAHIRAFAWAPEGSRIILSRGTYEGNLVINKSAITLEGDHGAILTSVSDTILTVISDRFVAKNLKFMNCDVAVDLQGGAEDTKLSGIVYGSGVSFRLKSPTIYPFTAGNTDPIGDTITIPAGHTLIEGAKGVFTTTGILPTGIMAGTTYYVRNPNNPINTFQVSLSQGGAIVPLLSTGSGTFGDGRIYGLEAKTKFNTWLVSDGTNTYGVGDFNSPDGIQQAHDVASAGDCITILPGVYKKFTVTADRLQFKGLGGGEVRINGEALADPCITVLGSYNQFDNFVLENAAVGIDCTSSGPISASYNIFSPTVVFSPDIKHAIKMPPTLTEKHYNYHPIVSGRLQGGIGLLDPNNLEVTIGDGTLSWGDYVGPNAIQLAINNESEGTKLIVRPGAYDPFILTKNNFIIEGSGSRSVIRATAPTDTQCIEVVNVPVPDGGGNKISGFYLLAYSNGSSANFNTVGIKVWGSDNIFESIQFEETGDARIERHKKYEVTSGFRNRFIPHTGAPTGYVSWTVGDGVRSFGDFNGSNGITQALAALPTQPSGTAGEISGVVGNTATFYDSTASFDLRDLYRFLTIKPSGLGNEGSHKVIGYIDANTVILERADGVFVDETGIFWNFLTGAKIWVLPGQYDGGSVNFNIPATMNDIEIEAWGGGNDTLIVGDVADSPLLTLDGNRCRIKGFRFVGGVPNTGVAIAVAGNDNTFDSNVYETAVRFDITGIRNKVYDAPEAQDRTYLTVSTSPSRGDYVGMDDQVIQDALTAAYADPQINKVVLGKGTWVFNNPVQVPSGIILEGSGYDTVVMNGGALPMAFDLLDEGGGIGGQTITGIRFGAFTNSLSVTGSTVSDVFAYNNWLLSGPAPIDIANITGNLTMNL